MGNSTGMIVGIIVALVVVVGGLFIFMGGDDEADESTSETTTTQTQQEAAPEEPASNIVELAQATDSLSTLVTAVVAADLVDTLSGGEFTVFAPTNDAFAALPEGTLESLLEEENVGDLTDILTYHVVPSAALSTDLSDGMMLTTVQGDTLEVSIDNGVVTINDATVVSADIEASNGVVHVIDSVLLPN